MHTLGVTPVQNLSLLLNATGMSRLTWSEPEFSSEGSVFSYEISLQNQHEDLLYTNTTIRTYQQLVSLNISICDTAIATVTAISGQYNSSKNVTRQYTGGIIISSL